MVVCDLIGIGSFLVERARALIAERPGIPPSNVMISATHTHAGPAGVRGRGEPVLVEDVARKIAGAVRVAHRNAVDGSLKYGRTELSSIAQNRRFPDGPIDHRLDVVAADTPAGGNIATIARYGCHATTLERDNLDITAEYPGEACRTIEQVIGGGSVGLFFNGACGNVNPAWIRQQYDEVRRLGTVVGAKAAALSQELRPLGINHQAHNIRWEELTDRPVDAGVAVSGPLRAASLTFEAPYRTGPSEEEFSRQLAEIEAEYSSARDAGTQAELRAAGARVTRARMEALSLARVRNQPPFRHEEVQAFALGDNLHVIGLPGEVFIETGDEIREKSGLENVLVVTYANDYPGYFCRAEAYDEGGYEPGTTPFAPEADALLVEAAMEVLGRVS